MITTQFSTNLILPATVDIDDQKTRDIVQQLTSGIRVLAQNLDLYTGALSPLKTSWLNITPAQSILGNNHYKFYAFAAVAIPYGAFVNFTNYSGTQVQARLAKADIAANIAVGFCLQSLGVGIGEYGEFIVGPGIHNGLSGLTPGAWYYTSPTSVLGQVTLTNPTTVGQIRQRVGMALTDTTLLVGSLNDWVQL